jgi:hypothetical protein
MTNTTYFFVRDLRASSIWAVALWIVVVLHRGMIEASIHQIVVRAVVAYIVSLAVCLLFRFLLWEIHLLFYKKLSTREVFLGQFVEERYVEFSRLLSMDIHGRKGEKRK